MRATTRWCAAVVVAMLIAVSGPLSVQAAATAPVLSQFSASPKLWRPALSPLTLQGSFSTAGTFEVSVTDVCTSAVVRTSTGSAVQGANTLTIDGLVPDVLADGVYLITLTPKSLEGSAGVSSSVAVSVSESGDSALRIACSNAQRLTLVVESEKALAVASVAAADLNFPEAQRIVLIPANAKPWLVALATVYAARNGVPLMFTATDKLTYAVKQDLEIGRAHV